MMCCSNAFWHVSYSILRLVRDTSAIEWKRFAATHAPAVLAVWKRYSLTQALDLEQAVLLSC